MRYIDHKTLKVCLIVKIKNPKTSRVGCNPDFNGLRVKAPGFFLIFLGEELANVNVLVMMRIVGVAMCYVDDGIAYELCFPSWRQQQGPL